MWHFFTATWIKPPSKAAAGGCGGGWVASGGAFEEDETESSNDGGGDDNPMADSVSHGRWLGWWWLRGGTDAAPVSHSYGPACRLLGRRGAGHSQCVPPPGLRSSPLHSFSVELYVFRFSSLLMCLLYCLAKLWRVCARSSNVLRHFICDRVLLLASCFLVLTVTWFSETMSVLKVIITVRNKRKIWWFTYRGSYKNKEIEPSVKKSVSALPRNLIRRHLCRSSVIPGFYAKTKYSSYAWPRINCSTHTTKSFHR
jgi:hypothetical protein